MKEIDIGVPYPLRERAELVAPRCPACTSSNVYVAWNGTGIATHQSDVWVAAGFHCRSCAHTWP